MTPVTTTRPNAILEGGPADEFAEHERIRHVAAAESTVKVLRGNRREHFVQTSRTAAYDGGELRVYVWSGRTYVAE